MKVAVEKKVVFWPSNERLAFIVRGRTEPDRRPPLVTRSAARDIDRVESWRMRNGHVARRPAGR
jgi:hypothetical protein